MKASQQTMMEHSEVKIRLLETYLKKYLQILSLSPFTSDIYLYDLFSGEGIYENGGKGSPIIFLETIKNTYFAHRNKGIGKFNCLFNDFNRNKIEKLKTIVQEKKLHYSDIGELNYSIEDYNDILKSVVNEINQFKNEKAFVFIDPYGYKDIRLKDISQLLKSNKSEVLLFLPTQFMFRFEKKGAPECLLEFINEIVPFDDWPKSETGIDFIEKLTEAFRNSLPNYFVDSFIITRELNQFFCLFFFTSHIYGFDRIVWTDPMPTSTYGTVSVSYLYNSLIPWSLRIPKFTSFAMSGTSSLKASIYPPAISFPVLSIALKASFFSSKFPISSIFATFPLAAASDASLT